MRKTIQVLFLALLLAPAILGADDEPPAGREIKYGKPYDSIGTFNGWSYWVGYDANFSDSYAPEGEAYAWVVHFAPEGIYLSMQKSKNVYSGVDVNAGFNFFYGLVKSPDGDILKRSFVGDMSARTFSLSAFDTSMAKLGPMSNLSAGISSSITGYTNGVNGPMVRAVQFGAGMSVSYALVANPFPFSVSLDTESTVAAGFYPIAIWETPDETLPPRQAILENLTTLSRGQGKAFADIHNAYMASRMLTVLESFPLNDMIDEFVTRKKSISRIDEFLNEVAEWNETGDTKKLPEILKPKVPPREMYRLLNPLQSAVTAAFETGYKRGYDSTTRTDTIYADCMQTLRAKVGQKVRIEITKDEIVALMPELKGVDLEGVKVVFDNPPETYISSQQTETAIPLKNGTAVFTVSIAAPSTFLLGVRIDKTAKTKNKYLELCRRLVIFE